MKKFINIFLALILISGCFMLTACGEEEKYWENTNTKVTTFTENATNQFIFAEDNKLTYTAGIEEQISSNADYTELNTEYFSILNNLMLMFKKHYTNLSIIPGTKNDEVKSAYKNFDGEIDKMQSSIDSFLTYKASFEQHVIANYTSDAANQELTLYKRHFKDLIFTASSFNGSFENLYTKAYLSIPTISIETYKSGYENLISTITVNKILKSFVTYIFDDNTGLIPSGVDTNAITQINKIQTALKSTVYKENKVAIINEVALYTKAFDNELANYYFALEKVNMSSVRENSVSYLEANPSNETYVNEINDFNQNIITIYVNEVLKLIA